jgi:hypothetical protein
LQYLEEEKIRGGGGSLVSGKRRIDTSLRSPQNHKGESTRSNFLFLSVDISLLNTTMSNSLIHGMLLKSGTVF